MTTYEVISPEMSGIEPMLYGQGPIEYFCCYIQVEASSKREARRKAIQHPDFQEWVDWQREDNKCPFTGLEVNELT